jgi:alpha-ribazole phosphatase
MELTFIRHPPTHAAPGLCVGRLDVACAPDWESGADRVFAALEPPARVCTSPLQRCRVPASRAANAWRVPLTIDARLAELDFGRWEGRAWAEIPRAESDPWAEDPLRVAPPGGETYAALLERVAAFLADVEAAGESTVAFAHAGSIRAALVRLLRLEPASAWAFDVAHLRVTRLRRHAGVWTLVALNAGGA